MDGWTVDRGMGGGRNGRIGSGMDGVMGERLDIG